jgi:glycosyltransferase involved in cell wall biosynthesis
MRINYVAYFDPLRYGGGGEMILRGLIEAGRRRGHTIRVTTVRPHRTAIDEGADLYWLTDAFNFPGTLKSLGAWRHFDEAWLRDIAARRPFVHFSNAYVDICNLGWLPCSGNAAPRCPYKSPWTVRRNLAAKDFGTTCFARKALVRELFERSRLNVFLSPLHERITHDVLQLAHRPPSYVMKPAIDAQRFNNRGMERDIDYLFVGVIGEAKGLDEMRARYRDADIHFVGRVAPGAKLDFGTHHGHVPYDRVPELMNRARHFVFLPRWPEPQGRVVVEAALCGCKLVTNDNVGATSFPFDLSRSENFAGAEDEFWKRMESLH